MFLAKGFLLFNGILTSLEVELDSVAANDVRVEVYQGEVDQKVSRVLIDPVRVSKLVQGVQRMDVVKVDSFHVSGNVCERKADKEGYKFTNTCKCA